MLTATDRLEHLRSTIRSTRARLESHPLYHEIRTVPELRLFMQSHIFAVWDFMSLLKSLQNDLTSVAVPWVPSRFPEACRLINEIVLGEESDNLDHGYGSHFELYLQGMREAGADTSPVSRLVDSLRNGISLHAALDSAAPPPEAREFVEQTFAMIGRGRTHATASAFTFGREDLIPDMFREMVRDMSSGFAGLGVFEYYLNRHVEVDGDSHGPMALRMLAELCGEDDARWEEAAAAAESALQARLRLWDAILARVQAARAG